MYRACVAPRRQVGLTARSRYRALRSGGTSVRTRATRCRAVAAKWSNTYRATAASRPSRRDEIRAARKNESPTSHLPMCRPAGARDSTGAFRHQMVTDPATLMRRANVRVPDQRDVTRGLEPHDANDVRARGRQRDNSARVRRIRRRPAAAVGTRGYSGCARHISGLTCSEDVPEAPGARARGIEVSANGPVQVDSVAWWSGDPRKLPVLP